MTWGEFKKVCEEQGVKDHHEISWIDISGWESIEVEDDRLMIGKHSPITEDTRSVRIS